MQARGRSPGAAGTAGGATIENGRSGDGGGTVYTIGHSNHPAERFLELLRMHGIQVILDTRSRPYSRHAPQFNARALKAGLPQRGVRYHFLGRELGGRPEDAGFYDGEGRVDYSALARTGAFRDGIQRVRAEACLRRVALLCSEEDPAGCHRRLLVGWVLAGSGVPVLHIRGDGSLQREGETPGLQPPLFPESEEGPRKSIRSVSRRRRPPSSSGR